MNIAITRSVYWLVCLMLLGCTLANASPIFEISADASWQFTQPLPPLKWFGPDIWLLEHRFDFDAVGPGCVFRSGKDCFLKFFFKFDPPAGDDWFFGKDPDPPTVPGADPVTPEPPAWTLLGLGLVGIAMFRHKFARLSRS